MAANPSPTDSGTHFIDTSVEGWADDFVSAANGYREAGYRVIPLRGRTKGPPPKGFTGATAQEITVETFVSWLMDSRCVGGNIAIHLRSPGGSGSGGSSDGEDWGFDVIGLDVDHYLDKTGADTLASLEGEHGLLPDTWRSTSRPGVRSSIRFYRVPEGSRFVGSLAGGIEICQSTHRYALVWPSIHPDTGRTYRWFAPGSHEPVGVGVIPVPGAFAELPAGWVEFLTDRSDTRYQGGNPIVSQGRAREWVGSVEGMVSDSLKGGGLDTFERTVLEPAKAAVAAGESRHSACMRALAGLVADTSGGAGQSLYDRGRAVEQLREWFQQALGPDLEGRRGEFDRNLAYAIANPMLKPGGGLGQLGGIGDVEVSLPEEFWAEMDPLLETVIRQAARASLVSPDALLGCLMIRALAATPPSTLAVTSSLVLAVSLNSILCIVGESGTGKSKVMKVASDLLPISLGDIDSDMLGLGSGEGIIEAYIGEISVAGPDGKPIKERVQIKDRILFHHDEAQQLLRLGERKGSTLLQILRSVWSGENVGQANASADRQRQLIRGTYRACFLFGIQPSFGAELVGDAEGGTPQRFWWSNAIHPETASIEFRDVPAMPPCLSWSGRSGWAESGGELVEVGDDDRVLDVISFPVEVKREMHNDLVSTRWLGLDAHRNVCRVRAAVALALLESEGSAREVLMRHWVMAGVWMEYSDAIRAEMIHGAEQAQTAERRAQMVADVERAGSISSAQAEAQAEAVDRRIEKVSLRVAGVVARKVHRLGRATWSDCQQAIAGRDRKALGGASEATQIGIDEALEREWIVEVNEVYKPGVEPE